ncbi:hypothetical protein ACQP6U_17970 [Acinetobacter baumannii]|uniref:hypothetical protein n=1 Tax=Acinetobacter baumannii TaxID=470 RepID=UPI003D05F0A5
MTENLDPVPSTTEENTTTNTPLNTFNDSSINESIPDKFKVTAEDGSVDYKATLSKMNESYTGLEKRIGSGDLPPKDVAGYKVERDGFDFEQFKSDESNQAFLTKAHEHGITNKQLDFLLSEYDSRVVDLVSTSSQLDTDTVVNSLKTEWGESYEQNMRNAFKGATTAGLTIDEFNDPLIGNNKALIKLAAYYGSQLNEDNPIHQAQVPVADDIETLMRSEAFLDTKHPEHKAVTARINAAYAKGFTIKR